MVLPKFIRHCKTKSKRSIDEEDIIYFATKYQYGNNKKIKPTRYFSRDNSKYFVINAISLFFVHCGDSRIYKVKKQKAVHITQDHTAANFIKTMGECYKTRKYSDNVLYSCIGIIKNPEIQTGSGILYQNDGFILVSDGVYRFICIENIGLLHADELTEYALQNESNDNVTAITVTLSSKRNQFYQIYQRWLSYFKW